LASPRRLSRSFCSVNRCRCINGWANYTMCCQGRKLLGGRIRGICEADSGAAESTAGRGREGVVQRRSGRSSSLPSDRVSRSAPVQCRLSTHRDATGYFDVHGSPRAILWRRKRVALEYVVPKKLRLL